MSLDAMLAVLKLPAGETTSSERLLLIAMAESASESGELSAYARSQAFMAFKCGWSDADHVRKVMRSLQVKGLLALREAGSGHGQSSYYLTFIDRVPEGNLAKVWRKHREASQSPSTGGDPSPSTGGDPSPSTDGDHISVVPNNKHPLEVLTRWFAKEVWPLYPKRVNRPGALRELRHLAPDAELRACIIAGLKRLLEDRERQRHDSGDGFMPELPILANWLRDRRWEDEYEHD
jgi:hypothetical protein